MFGSGATTLMFSNEEINNIMEIIRPLEESSLLIRSLGETIKNEAKEQKWGFFKYVTRYIICYFIRKYISR